MDRGNFFIYAMLVAAAAVAALFWSNANSFLMSQTDYSSTSFSLKREDDGSAGRAAYDAYQPDHSEYGTKDYSH